MKYMKHYCFFHFGTRIGDVCEEYARYDTILYSSIELARDVIMLCTSSNNHLLFKCARKQLHVVTFPILFSPRAPNGIIEANIYDHIRRENAAWCAIMDRNKLAPRKAPNSCTCMPRCAYKTIISRNLIVTPVKISSSEVV
ncbi:hypothetical protein CLIB1423_11S00562 [[Candida] railenensis]|uniref:Uncharacterized protein n=1 Tax=[Candida] railenensis TaxID=45579 RepID=A0A9P0QR86_9ASCO|nr:hypothetical protein CLIB1423_11S00562 [[Candida] railenensis]